jgi:hypothetical protein
MLESNNGRYWGGRYKVALAERKYRRERGHDIRQRTGGQCSHLQRETRSIPLSLSKMTPDAANCYSGHPSRAENGQTITQSDRPDATCRVYSAETTTLPNYHCRNATKKADFKPLFLFVCIPTGHVPMPPLPPPPRNVLANCAALHIASRLMAILMLLHRNESRYK